MHPWFDWKKTERWINNPKAVKHWMNHRGGSTQSLEDLKKKSSNYPDDFTSKTY